MKKCKFCGVKLGDMFFKVCKMRYSQSNYRFIQRSYNMCEDCFVTQRALNLSGEYIGS